MMADEYGIAASSDSEVVIRSGYTCRSWKKCTTGLFYTIVCVWESVGKSVRGQCCGVVGCKNRQPHQNARA